MENTNLVQTQKTFETFCSMMDKKGWNYQKDTEKLYIETGVRGDDLPIHVRLVFDPERLLVRLFSPLDFKVSEEQMANAALAICIINDNLVDGNFDMDVTKGSLCYRMSLSFRESLISEEAFDFFIDYAVYVIDEFNDKLLMLAKGMLTPAQLLGSIKGE